MHGQPSARLGSLALAPPARRLALALLALGAAGSIATGCISARASSGSLHMRSAQTLLPVGAPAEGRAQVVFLMPERSRGVVGVVDQRGTFYGELDSETAFVVDVEPGRYRFYAIRDRNAYAVDVPRLEAGQTAYVGGEDPRFTSFAFRSYSGCDAASVAARRSLDRLRRVERDPSVPERDVIASLGDVPRRIDEADRDLAAMTPAHRALRTVDAEQLASSCDGAPGE